MKRLLLVLLLGFSALHAAAQEPEEDYDYEEETEEPEKPVVGKEIGIDLNFSASNSGGYGYSGTAGIGVKFGLVQRERFVFGPSVRYQHSWQKFNNQQTGFSIYGGGVFAHARFFNYFFVGADLEFLSTPVQYSTITGIRSWVPVALVGGGFSHSFGDFRIQGGVMYDLVNHVNSPLRQGYFMRNSQGVYLPLLYRIGFFFPLN